MSIRISKQGASISMGNSAARRGGSGIKINK